MTFEKGDGGEGGAQWQSEGGEFQVEGAASPKVLGRERAWSKGPTEATGRESMGRGSES